MPRYQLRTLLIVVTAAALPCGGWALAFDAARYGRLNMAQFLVLAVMWGIAIFGLWLRR